MRKEIDKKKNVTQVKWNSKSITCIPEVLKKHVMINYGSHLSTSLQKAFTTLIDTKYL